MQKLHQPCTKQEYYFREIYDSLLLTNPWLTIPVDRSVKHNTIVHHESTVNLSTDYYHPQLVCLFLISDILLSIHQQFLDAF